MLHHYFQQKHTNPFSSTMDQPVKELMDLNTRILQSFSYLTPTELLLMRRPEEIMEKNLEVFIENSHTALAYMQNMFDIMEKHWLKNFDEAVKNTKEATHFIKKPMSTQHSKSGTTKQTAKPAASKAKTAMSKSRSSATKLASTTVKPSTSSTVKKKSAKPTSSATSKSSLKSATKSQGSSSSTKHVSSSMPQHFSSPSSSLPHTKPVMKDIIK